MEIKFTPDNFEDYFKNKYLMLIGEKDLFRITHFITGYQSALGVYKIENNSFFSHLSYEFHEYVAKKYGLDLSWQGYPAIIFEACDKNHDKAVDTFFEIYDEYKKLVTKS